MEDIASPGGGIGSSKGRPDRLVTLPTYRKENLEENSIFLVTENDKAYPAEVANLVAVVGTRPKEQTLSIEDVQKIGELNNLWEYSAESRVSSFFRDTVLSNKTTERPDPLLRDEKEKIKASQVPNNPSSRHNVSIPTPDMLYGYSDEIAFSSEEWQSQSSLFSTCTKAEAVANKAQLLFPFLVVEAKGDGALRIAVNQCLGGASACVRIANRLNERLRRVSGGQAELIDSTAFSVALNGIVAILYVTWFSAEEKQYYMRQVRCFRLSPCHPGDFVEFHYYIHNILDWGRNARLAQIKAGLRRLKDFELQRPGQPRVLRDTPGSPPSANTRSKKAGGSGGGSSQATVTHPEPRTPLPRGLLKKATGKRRLATTETPEVADDSGCQQDGNTPPKKRRNAVLTDPFNRRLSPRPPGGIENGTRGVVGSTPTTSTQPGPVGPPPAVPHHSRPPLAPVIEHENRRPEGDETPDAIFTQARLVNSHHVFWSPC